LVSGKKEESAANILFEIGRTDDAVNVCLKAQLYDTAKRLAGGNAQLMRKVTEAYHEYLAAKQDTGVLVEAGRTDVVSLSYNSYFTIIVGSYCVSF
jgi:hypothetical protein